MQRPVDGPDEAGLALMPSLGFEGVDPRLERLERELLVVRTLAASRQQMLDRRTTAITA